MIHSAHPVYYWLIPVVAICSHDQNIVGTYPSKCITDVQEVKRSARTHICHLHIDQGSVRNHLNWKLARSSHFRVDELHQILNWTVNCFCVKVQLFLSCHMLSVFVWLPDQSLSCTIVSLSTYRSDLKHVQYVQYCYKMYTIMYASTGNCCFHYHTTMTWV